jgi:peptidoglycan/xylan/chitin deacetylase (PgdA/CDA1 family)
LVRQDRYTLPILRYDVSDPQATTSLVAHAQRLKQDGYVLGTFAGFRDLLLSQEQRDVRLQPNLILIAVTGVSAENVKTVSDALYAGGIKATLFVATKDLGLKGITEKMMKTLRANGFDIQSAGHTGDDLRALTNAQVTLELQQSRALLEEYTQADVFAVAYPQGGTNDRVTQFATEAGYLLGLSHAPERSFTREQFLRLPSFEVFPTMTADEVSKLVKGS